MDGYREAKPDPGPDPRIAWRNYSEQFNLTAHRLPIALRTYRHPSPPLQFASKRFTASPSHSSSTLYNRRSPETASRPQSRARVEGRPNNQQLACLPPNRAPAMDFILEGFDTFLFDPIYATLFPATSYSGINNAANATISSREISTTFRNTFVYQPSTKYLSLTPSSYAYTTSWPRDHIGRQALSLFLITWYVSCFLSRISGKS